MKRLTALTIIAITLFLTGCNQSSEKEYVRYSSSFSDTFDTLTIVLAYTETEEEFNNYLQDIHERFKELHKYYDIYNSYEGINNLKTINDNAGIQPVKVSDDIINLLADSIRWSKEIGPKTNIAFGPVTAIWHYYRSEALFDPSKAELPPMDKLLEAAKYTDINDVIINEEEKTVFLKHTNMRLDVGALAKGYAVEVVAQEMMEKGMISGVISSGGNIRTIGKPLGGSRDTWNIGIQDPDAFLFSDNRNLDSVLITDLSVVSSGDYQRYYHVDGKSFHHIIDPDTLMPGEYYRAATVVAEDSGLADFVSTEIFLLPFDKSFALVESLAGVEAIWVMPDGEIRMTEGFRQISSNEQNK